MRRLTARSGNRLVRTIAALCSLALVVCLSAPASGADSRYRFEDVPRVVAFADVHGAYAELVTLLRETGIVDESLTWRARDTHLVSLGDLLDRGPDSRKVMDLLMRLEDEAKEAGGAVHLVLGNHEVMNLVGDLRYVSAEEFAAFAGEPDASLRDAAWQRILAADPDASRADFDRAYPVGYFAHRQAFSASGEYGKWLRDKPFLVVIDETAFVHGGLPPMVARLGLDGTNEALQAELERYLDTWQSIRSELRIVSPVPFQQRPDALASLAAESHATELRKLQDGALFTPAGPSWFRGQALCYPHAEADNLAAALEVLDVDRVVQGHTVSGVGRVRTRFDGHVILLDTGMLAAVYKGTPSALVFENGRWTVIYANRQGERAQPDAVPRAVGPRPAGLDDDALENWLETAEVVAIEELDAGITEPQRVTLRKDGIELRAVFKQLSTTIAEPGRMRSSFDSDRFEYEVAAYRLDRLLGLDMVPVAVPRTIDRRRGILQFWIDDSINLRHMLEGKLQPSGWCDTAAQYSLMNVFDVLIHNSDRTQENALFTRDWKLVLIDHSRAFATHMRPPLLLYRGETKLPASLAERLRLLDREALQAELGPFLHRRQIEAILKRRDRLLSESGVATADR